MGQRLLDSRQTLGCGFLGNVPKKEISREMQQCDSQHSVVSLTELPKETVEFILGRALKQSGGKNEIKPPHTQTLYPGIFLSPSPPAQNNED